MGDSVSATDATDILAVLRAEATYCGEMDVLLALGRLMHRAADEIERLRNERVSAVTADAKAQTIIDLFHDIEKNAAVGEPEWDGISRRIKEVMLSLRLSPLAVPSVAEQVRAAQVEVASWPQEKRASVVLEGPPDGDSNNAPTPRRCPVSYQHNPHDACDGSPASEAMLLAQEIEDVGKGLGILGRSLEGGRELLPEEDALVLAALRAYRLSTVATSAVVEIRDIVLGAGEQGWQVWLVIGNQQFSIGLAQDQRELAEASAKWLREALARTVSAIRTGEKT